MDGLNPSFFVRHVKELWCPQVGTGTTLGLDSFNFSSKSIFTHFRIVFLLAGSDDGHSLPKTMVHLVFSILFILAIYIALLHKQIHPITFFLLCGYGNRNRKEDEKINNSNFSSSGRCEKLPQYRQCQERFLDRWPYINLDGM